MFKTFPPYEIPHLMHMFYVKCPNSSKADAKSAFLSLLSESNKLLLRNFSVTDL